MMQVARRISQTPKKSFGMYETAAKLGVNGTDIIHLEVGRPHADTPLHIKQAVIDALLAGNVHYSDLQGLPKVRRALAEKLRAENGIDLDEDEVLITNGLTHGSFCAFMAVLNPGDEVILFEPYYPQHIGKIAMTGAVPVFVKLDASRNFSINPDRLAASITPRSRMIVLVNPNNPTGRVYSLEELQAIANLAIKHNLVVVCDEVYEQIVFARSRHISIASLPGMRDRTISLFAFTKSFAMDGWRLGYAAAPRSILPAMLEVSANDVTHVNTFIQHGAYAAVTGPRKILDELLADDSRKRDLVVSRLNQMPGVTCSYPEGTIYAFADIRGTGLSSDALAHLILEKGRVALESGRFYGEAGEGFLRVCFGSESVGRTEEAMQRVSRVVSSLS